MPNWIPLAILPNISMQQGHRLGCDIASIVAAKDDRLIGAFQEQPKLKTFLERFSDQQGNRFSAQDDGRDMPAVLICRSDYYDKISSASTAAAFRDLIAVTIICNHRLEYLLRPSRRKQEFSDIFAFYPFMLSTDGEHLTALTPAIASMGDQPEHFHPQSDPSTKRETLTAADAPDALIKPLLAAWRRTLDMPKPDRADRQVMRSLNMAYHALKQPGGQESTLYDWGRLGGLWISAFEILANNSQNSGKKDVITLIDSFEYAQCKDRRLTTKLYAFSKEGEKRNPIQCTLPSYLYLAINQARNDFLHGNAIDEGALKLPHPSQVASIAAHEDRYASPAYTDFAPALYLAALCARLGVRAEKDETRGETQEQLIAALCQPNSVSQIRRRLTKAVLKAAPVLPPSEGC